MKKSHPFFLFLINSNIFVSFCVLSLALSSEFLLITSEISFPSKVSQFVFFATIFTYNFQRIVKLRKSKKDHIGIGKMETVKYKIKELMHDQKKRLLSTVHSYIGKGIEHTSRQSASWSHSDLCPIADKFGDGLR